MRPPARDPAAERQTELRRVLSGRRRAGLRPRMRQRIGSAAAERRPASGRALPKKHESEPWAMVAVGLHRKPGRLTFWRQRWRAEDGEISQDGWCRADADGERSGRLGVRAPADRARDRLPPKHLAAAAKDRHDGNDLGQCCPPTVPKRDADPLCPPVPSPFLWVHHIVPKSAVACSREISALQFFSLEGRCCSATLAERCPDGGRVGSHRGADLA